MPAQAAAARPAVPAASLPGGGRVMANIGYARVSTRGQNDDSQVDDLTAYGCEKIFTDTASGKHAARPELDKALAYLRAGDVFVITRLSRAMRSLKHLLALADELRERGVGLVVRPRLVQLPGVGGISLTFQNPLGVARLPPVLRVVMIGTISGVSAVFVAFLAVAFVSLAVRYRAGGLLLRQQVKWLALAAVAFVICLAIALLLTGASPSWLTGIAYTLVASIVLFGIPAAMTVAILRHRLYDIDRIISRTLEYAIVTGLLVGVYAGLVLLATQALPVSLSTPVAVAGATLAAAALFSPLRRRVQRIVDRRFNRARYDAESTVAAFAARLKDMVDLDSVRDDLAGVVHQALEPAHLSVWIRPHE